ncbi:DUF5694 domain-containing protein [uncultured Sphingomonas sp.]|uniref:DUF5694 domain-containing protein n=1 Tax=uncultured Sphingomonas sp. TaxID=158754 RepID=UPI0025EA84A2|nr:DUF5694 domain-containing protein [uncultured Sphingomonas sp.]
MKAWTRGVVVGVALAAVAAAGAVQAQRFDPRAHKGPKRGVPNEVAVLGTTHLSGMPKTFDPATLGVLIDRMAAWRPNAIAIETLSGLQCDTMRRYPTRYADSIKSYCPDVSAAATATGMDVPAANAAAEAMLAKWPASPTAADRRKLTATFLAAGERDSALVQWLRLAPADRVVGDGLDAALVEAIEKYRVRRNETTSIAAPLAARLGHERLWPMDDHTADRPDGDTDPKAYGAAITKAWDNPMTKRRMEIFTAIQAQVDTPDKLMAMYRRYNAPDMGGMAYTSDFGAALEEPSPQGFGRGYVAYWEVRNLRMAANIRDVIGLKPGMRTLVIVGASHKPYLDAYLDQMHDVRIVDVLPLLK